MCIRDRNIKDKAEKKVGNISFLEVDGVLNLLSNAETVFTCLLYTSDAADERSSVDLGGRRIIKKKKQADIHEWRNIKNRILHITNRDVQN